MLLEAKLSQRYVVNATIARVCINLWCWPRCQDFTATAKCQDDVHVKEVQLDLHAKRRHSLLQPPTIKPLEVVAIRDDKMIRYDGQSWELWLR